jgi:hypothetical protein
MAVEFKVGLLKQIIMFERNNGSDGVDDYGELLETRCYLEKMGGSRANEENEIILNSTWKMICRFQIALENELSASSERLRCVIDNRFFVIQSYEKVNMKKAYYKFVLTETES